MTAPMTDANRLFDTDILRRHRARAASRAADHDFLLHRVAEDFAERVGIIQRDFPTCLNAGAHHGVLSEHLLRMPSVGGIVELDDVAPPVRSTDARVSRVSGSLEALPFADAAFDLAVSGLSLQWVNDLPGALVQLRRALKPDGLLLAAVIGGGSLSELRSAWVAAEDAVTGGASPRVAPMADLSDLGGLLQRAGFALPVVDQDSVRVRYKSGLAAMRDVKGMGASNMLVERSRRPVTRGLLAAAAAMLEQQTTEADGRVALTFEILTLTAWVPHESQQKPLKPGSATARLADALGVPERSAGDKAGRS